MRSDHNRWDESLGIESLERRMLLAAQLLADYYPLTPRSAWTYDVIEEDLDRSTLNVSIAKKKRMADGRATSRVIYNYDGNTIDTLQSFDPDGKLRIHAAQIDEIKADFGTGLTLPRVLKQGYSKVAKGDLDLEWEGFEGDGGYTSRVTIGKRGMITVPAGTFKAVRVKIQIDVRAEEDVAFGVGPEAEGRVTLVLYLAKGVGVVQSQQSYDLDADVVVDHRNEQGSATLELRSYRIAEGAAGASATMASLFNGGKRIEAESVL